MFTGSDGGAGFDAVSRSVRAFIPSSYKSMNSLAFLLAVPADTPALLQAKSDPPNPHKKAQKYLKGNGATPELLIIFDILLETTPMLVTWVSFSVISG